MTLRDWVRVPTGWIQQRELRKLRWAQGKGSDNIAALMVLTVIAHHADNDSGIAKLTYDEICNFTSLSRVKVSGGLDVLERLNIIDGHTGGRSTYQLSDYPGTRPTRDDRFERPGGWGKLPARGLYTGGRISAFGEFYLRRPAELTALKLYFLFIERRDNKTNLANIGYESIHDYTGIDRNNIKGGLSVLAALGLVHVEHVPSTQSEYGIANAYRLAHLEPNRHMGTTGRGMTPEDFSSVS